MKKITPVAAQDFAANSQLAHPSKPKAQKATWFTAGDPDLAYHLRDHVSVRLDPFRPHVSSRHIVDTEKYLAADLHKKILSGQFKKLSSGHATFDYEGKMKALATGFGHTVAEACLLACSLPALLAEKEPPLARELAFLQQKMRLSPQALQKLVDHPLQLLATLKEQKTFMPVALTPQAKPVHAEDALRLERLENQRQTTRPARRAAVAKTPPPARKPVSAIAREWPKHYVTDRDPLDIEMVTVLTGETILPAGFYKNITDPKAWMRRNKPETAAAKIVLLATGVDLGLIPQGDADNPYSEMQDYLQGNSGGMNGASLALRLVLARTYGAEFFATRFDPDEVYRRNLGLQQEAETKHVLRLPMGNVKARHAVLHPGVNAFDWTKQQHAVLQEIDSHTRRWHFSLNPDTLETDILPSHPQYARLIEHRYKMACARFGKNDTDVTAMMDNKYQANAPKTGTQRPDFKP